MKGIDRTGIGTKVTTTFCNNLISNLGKHTCASRKNKRLSDAKSGATCRKWLRHKRTNKTLGPEAEIQDGTYKLSSMGLKSSSWATMGVL